MLITLNDKQPSSLKFVNAKFPKRIMAEFLVFQFWLGIFSNKMSYNAFDIEIISVRSRLIQLYVQHNKTHPAAPSNEMATFVMFQKYIKQRLERYFHLMIICCTVESLLLTQKKSGWLNLSLMLSIIWCIFGRQKILLVHL